MTEISLFGTLSGHQNPIYALEVDSSSNVLYSAGNDKGIVEWDLEELKFKRVLCTVPASVYCLKIIPNTDLLIAGMRNGELFVIERTAPKLLAKLKVDKGAVLSVQVLKNKNELIAIGEEGKAYVWSLVNFDLLYTFQVSTSTVRAIALSEDEKLLAFGDKNGDVTLCDINDFHTMKVLKAHEMGVSSMLFWGNKLYTGGRDAKMYKWSIPALEKEAEVTPHFFTVYGIDVLPELNQLVTVSRDKTLKIWDTEFKLVKNISKDRGIDSHQLSINSLVYHAGLHLLCTAGDDKLIKVWSVQVGSEA